MGNKQGQPNPEFTKSCQKTQVSDEIFLLKPIEQQNFNALQVVSKAFRLSVEMYLKSLRHPNILRFINSIPVNDDLVIVVEKCSILDLSNTSDEEICFGLHSVLNLFEFLHAEVKLCGVDLKLENIFVNTSGIWKIGLFHSARKISSAHDIVYEIEKLAEFSVAVLEKCSLDHSEELSIWLHDIVENRQCKTVDISQIKSHPFFSNPFLETILFLDNLLLRSHQERTQFFEKLDERLRMIPEDVVANRLTPKLLSRHVVLDETAQAVFLPKFLTAAEQQEFDENSQPPFGILCPRLYKDFVIPEVIRVLHVREVEVRLVFLKNFHRYYTFIEKPVLVEDILPELMLGIRDTNDQIVAATLRALSELVPLLGGDTVMGGHRLKIFTDGKPKQQSNEVTSSSLSIESQFRCSAPGNPIPARSKQLPESIGVKTVILSERVPPEGGEDNVKITSVPVQSSPMLNGSEIAESIKLEVSSPGAISPRFDEKFEEWNSTDLGKRNRSFEMDSSNEKVDEWYAWDQGSENLLSDLNNFEPFDQVGNISEACHVLESVQESKSEGQIGSRSLSLKSLQMKSQNLSSKKDLKRTELSSKDSRELLVSENQIHSESNAVSMSRKPFPRATNPAKQTTDSLGSEFDIMAVDLKIKQEPSSEDKLFEEFFGDSFSSPAALSAGEKLNSEVSDVTGPSKFVPVEEEQEGNTWTEEGSGWDEF